MQKNARKVRCEALQLTKVILAAPSEETLERGVRNEPFIYFREVRAGAPLRSR